MGMVEGAMSSTGSAVEFEGLIAELDALKKQLTRRNIITVALVVTASIAFVALILGALVLILFGLKMISIKPSDVETLSKSLDIVFKWVFAPVSALASFKIYLDRQRDKKQVEKVALVAEDVVSKSDLPKSANAPNTHVAVYPPEQSAFVSLDTLSRVETMLNKGDLLSEALARNEELKKRLQEKEDELAANEKKYQEERQETAKRLQDLQRQSDIRRDVLFKIVQSMDRAPDPAAFGAALQNVHAETQKTLVQASQAREQVIIAARSAI